MENKQHKYTNKLSEESSPYLLQHAHNPVNWYPWGEEALNKAEAENKLIIISIGYAACHWCHVMEHESFEDEEVAEFMNNNFVAIKIDREERPDIDQIYMNAVQLLSGSGGWPLNCIALSDGRPIYGGTYFTKAQWLDMLSQVSDFVKKNPDKAEQQASSLTKGIQSDEVIVRKVGKPEFEFQYLNLIFDSWKTTLDFYEGGQKRAPKFPLPIGWQFLLQYYYSTGNQDALKAVNLTLNKMADGGIYDQIGGGFARYSTDMYWKVPHFEKMLYDNAQLVSLYSSAFQLTKDTKYKSVVKESLEFVKRELTSPDGGFYSSLDADSEGEEGKFYVWTKKDIDSILGGSSALFVDYYSITEEGNWEEEKNILLKIKSEDEICKKYNISNKELIKQIEDSKNKLLKEREKRIRPGLDDKILTSWNALMLKAYVDAYKVFDDKDYLKTAVRSADFLNTKIRQSDKGLFRNFKNGKASINAFLDDYAFTVEAFISLYQATFDEKYLNEALFLTEYSIKHFYDKKSGMFYYTSDTDPALIARKFEVSDNVIPASNSAMAKNLFILGHYFYNEEYIEMSKQMLDNVKENLEQGGAYYANWDILFSWIAGDFYEIAIAGNDCESKRNEFEKYYLPNVILSGAKNESSLSLLEGKFKPGQTMIYVCKEKGCNKPETDVNDAIESINKR